LIKGRKPIKTNRVIKEKKPIKEISNLHIDPPIHQYSAGLMLYHITPFSTPENIEDYPHLKNVPMGTFTCRLNKGMYFSLSEEHTIYYDSWLKSENQWKSAHLVFQTINKITLIDFNKNKPNWDVELNKFLLNHQIDGWLAYDDPNDNWREIYLFEPYKHVKFIKELHHDYQNIPKYIYKENDQKN
jgi:hypothetical protein